MIPDSAQFHNKQVEKLKFGRHHTRKGEFVIEEGENEKPPDKKSRIIRDSRSGRFMAKSKGKVVLLFYMTFR
jgi:hypothetical protein